jgi:pimeloyl-ACP methyl ester carboxylesterase
MQDLLLLHGAIGAADQLEPLKARLTGFRVHALSFSGHGGKEMPETFSIQAFAADVLAYMDEQGLSRVGFFGYSMGGYVALYLAKFHPERVERVVTLATKFHWDTAIAEREQKMLDDSKIEQKLPAFAETLRIRHAPNDWKEVLARTRLMLAELGRDNTLKPEDYPGIDTPCLILLGDRDKMITLEETVAVFQSLPKGQMGMLPQSPHPIEQVNLEALAFFISSFF